jgi:hypothetical protein
MKSMIRIKFPDGVYVPLEVYAEQMSKNEKTILKDVYQGKLHRRKIKGEDYIRIYKTKFEDGDVDSI